MFRLMSIFPCVLVAFVLQSHASFAQWITQPSGTSARLRGLSVVNERVAWASGTGGTVLRTLDGGASWSILPVPNANDLDFRDIEAFDAHSAYALSIGEGESSRIVKTGDGGQTWTLQLVNEEPDGFLNALAFWDSQHGLALGDPIGGRFDIRATDDGGKTWTRIDPEGMPEALPNEGAFAASGTCLFVWGDQLAWFGTSGGRVFRSEDRGKTWTVHQTPIRSASPSSGLFSLSFQNAKHGVAIGGDYEIPERIGSLVALTSDGGRSWSAPEGPEPGGYRSAVVFLPDQDPPTLIAVGPTGSDRSEDGGKSWTPLGELGFHAVDFANASTGWAVGDGGIIARFNGKRPDDR